MLPEYGCTLQLHSFSFKLKAFSALVIHSFSNSSMYSLSKQNIDEKKLRAVSASKIKDDIVKLSIGMLLLYVLCGGIAAYFSWKHNSKIGWTTVYKVLFAIFAFFCPAEYVTIYFTYKSDLLTYMERTKTEFVAPVVVATPTSL